MKTLNEEIGRIKDIMLINELGGGSLEDFMDMGFKKDREENPYMSKKYNPENEIEFPDSKVTDVVWRAGGLDNFHKGGGIWFGESKSDVEKFSRSVRREKDKVSHITLIWKILIIMILFGVAMLRLRSRKGFVVVEKD